MYLCKDYMDRYDAQCHGNAAFELRAESTLKCHSLPCDRLKFLKLGLLMESSGVLLPRLA